MFEYNSTAAVDDDGVMETTTWPISHCDGPDAGELVDDGYEGSEKWGAPVSSDLELARFCDANRIHDYAVMLRLRHQRTYARRPPAHWGRARRPHCARVHRRQKRTAFGDTGDDGGDGERPRQLDVLSASGVCR